MQGSLNQSSFPGRTVLGIPSQVLTQFSNIKRQREVKNSAFIKLNISLVAWTIRMAKEFPKGSPKREIFLIFLKEYRTHIRAAGKAKVNLCRVLPAGVAGTVTSLFGISY